MEKDIGLEILLKRITDGCKLSDLAKKTECAGLGVGGNNEGGIRIPLYSKKGKEVGSIYIIKWISNDAKVRCYGRINYEDVKGYKVGAEVENIAAALSVTPKTCEAYARLEQWARGERRAQSKAIDETEEYRKKIGYYGPWYEINSAND